jgi:hypothetical protein
VTEQLRFDVRTHEVAEQDVALLDARRVCRRHSQHVVDQSLELAALSAQGD